MMIKEEESLKTRLITSIQKCRAEMEKLYLELQLPVFEVTAAEASVMLLPADLNARLICLFTYFLG